jgi:hypothetical protein
MTTSVLLYAAGALLEGWLAVMLTISGRALRGADRRWMQWLAAGFACNTVRSALLSTGYGSVSLADHPNMVTATLATVALALMSVALMDYVALTPLAKRRIWLVFGPLLGGLWLAVTVGWLPRGNAVLIASLVFFGWAALFVRAARREPHSGHVLVVLAILTFPAIGLALKLGQLPPDLLPASEIIPLAAIGIAVLTTGLVGARWPRASAPRRRWPRASAPKPICVWPTSRWSSASRSAPRTWKRTSPDWRASTAASRTTCAGRWAASRAWPASRAPGWPKATPRRPGPCWPRSNARPTSRSRW